MSNRHTQESAADNILFVPLNRLKKSPRNVRKLPHGKADIAALAASIATHGMLQNLVVEREEGTRGDPTGDYLVTAGEGRRLALLLRAKRKEIPADLPVRCVLGAGASATEVSLAENAIRTDMHPADQYEAFARLHGEQGMAAEDIAARFGVTTAVVRQRLKLGAVSPKLLRLYRAEEMTLEQLTAFAITDDRVRQERVWRDLPQFNRSRGAILRALSEGQVATDDRRARFVGTEAYQAAGGTIIRDLFDPEGGGFFTDAELLNRLVGEKLRAAAQSVTAEGWKWVAAEAERDYAATSNMRRVYPEAVKLTREQKKRLCKSQTRIEALYEKHGDELPEAVLVRAERLQAQIETLERYVYKLADLAIAGAIVTLDADGELCIERGLVRPEDAPRAKTRTNGKDAMVRDAEGSASLSDALLADLSAHRTAALRDRLAENPAIALTATVHALAAAIFYPGGEDVSCLDLRGLSVSLSSHAPDIHAGHAGQQIAARHKDWQKRLPRDPAKLWACVNALTHEERLQLLAHCAALTVNALQGRSGVSEQALAHAACVAKDIALDMASYWQPTVSNYFGRIGKERIVESVRDVAGDPETKRIAGLKKPEMAAAAERLVAGKGWLPSLLRTPT